MKKVSLLLSVFLFFGTNGFAQGFDWVRTFTAPGPENKIIGSCVDAEGNFYFLGEFAPQAYLCGVPIIPHDIITTPMTTGVVIGKLSPQGELLWHKAIYNYDRGSIDCSAHGLQQLGDTAFMIMANMTLPVDHSMSNRISLYYLDTLLEGNDDYLMPTDSMSYLVTAFITFGNDGHVIEQHFLCLGLQDTNGNTLTDTFMGSGSSNRMYTYILSNESFGVDSLGNIYVVRQSNDRRYGGSDLETIWSVEDGTVGALKILVDGVHSLICPLEQRSSLLNQQLLKFSPHFDSLLAATYVFDSTHHDDYAGTQIFVYDFKVDVIGNSYLNLWCSGVGSPLMISHSDFPFIDTTSDIITMMIKYSSELHPSGLVQLSFFGNTDNIDESLLDAIFVNPNIIYSHIDEQTNSLYLSATVAWNPRYNMGGFYYGNDTLFNITKTQEAYWMRLDKDDLSFKSYGFVSHAGNAQNSGGEVGWVHEPKLTTQHNRVFAQTNFLGSIKFKDTTIYTNIPTLRDNAFLVWDDEGNQLSINNYHSYHLENLWEKPVVKDSIVYLPGTLYASAMFDTIAVSATGNSYAYIAAYVDTNFMHPYVDPNSREEQTIYWEQELSYSLADSPVFLTATATSGLPVAYSSADTSIAKVAGDTLFLLRVGSTTLTATQDGDPYHLPADPVTRTLTVHSEDINEAGQAAVRIYPNPARDIVYIALPTGETLKGCTLIESNGIRHDMHPENNQLHIADLPAGVYYLEVITNKNSHKRKLTKL